MLVAEHFSRFSELRTTLARVFHIVSVNALKKYSHGYGKEEL
jgi:hypothetical protein